MTQGHRGLGDNEADYDPIEAAYIYSLLQLV